MIESVWQYLKSNPLEIAAFIISVLTFFYTRRKIRASYAKINLETIYGSSETYYHLKIYSPEKGQSLFIKEIPTIYKKKSLFYRKLNYLVDYKHQIDNTTKEPIKDIYYIHLDLLKNLEKGQYMIKVKVDLLPYTLKYKFTFPLSNPMQNSGQLIG